MLNINNIGKILKPNKVTGLRPATIKAAIAAKDDAFTLSTPIVTLRNKTKALIVEIPKGPRSFYDRNSIKDCNGRELGFEELIFPKNPNMPIIGALIESYPNAKGLGVGETLRLTSIKQMIQGGYTSIQIEGAAQAALFHRKSGFSAQFANPEQARYVISKLSLNPQILGPDTVKQIEKVKTASNADAGYTAKANSAFDKFLDSINKYNKTAQQQVTAQDMGLSSTVQMALTAKDVVKNKAFYNQKFDEYGIKYKI